MWTAPAHPHYTNAGPALLAPDSSGQLPLHVAASNTHSAVVEILLSAAPAAVSVRDSQQQLPLHVAASQRHGAHALFALLAADPAAACSPGGPSRELPLHLAAQHVVSKWFPWGRLLQLVPDAVRYRDAGGNLPLHRAAEAGNEQAAEALLEAWPAAAMVRNAAGLTPLDAVLHAQALVCAGSPSVHQFNGNEIINTPELYCVEHLVLRLLRAMPPADAVRALAAAPEPVGSRWLDADTWSRMCGAQDALAAAWWALPRDSREEAAVIERCLLPGTLRRLQFAQAAALCLARAQRQAGLALPRDLVHSILHRAWADTMREGGESAAARCWLTGSSPDLGFHLYRVWSACSCGRWSCRRCRRRRRRGRRGQLCAIM